MKTFLASIVISCPYASKREERLEMFILPPSTAREIPQPSTTTTVVVRKMLQVLDNEEKKLFSEEVARLNELHFRVYKTKTVECILSAHSVHFISQSTDFHFVSQGKACFKTATKLENT